MSTSNEKLIEMKRRANEIIAAYSKNDFRTLSKLSKKYDMTLTEARAWNTLACE